MNMSAKNIPYKSIIMRCDCVNKNAFVEVVDRFSIVKYHSEMKPVWIELQKAAGQFDDYSDVDIKEYFEREVLPFAPDAWIDEKKSKVGYEIPFTRYFYKYEAPRPSAEIMAEIMDLETELSGSLEEVFDL